MAKVTTTVVEEATREDGSLRYQIVEKQNWSGSALTRQKVINAFNPVDVRVVVACTDQAACCFLGASGLSTTVSMGVQSRVAFAQRSGWR